MSSRILSARVKRLKAIDRLPEEKRLGFKVNINRPKLDAGQLEQEDVERILKTIENLDGKPGTSLNEVVEWLDAVAASWGPLGSKWRKLKKIPGELELNPADVRDFANELAGHVLDRGISRTRRAEVQLHPKGVNLLPSQLTGEQDLRVSWTNPPGASKPVEFVYPNGTTFQVPTKPGPQSLVLRGVRRDIDPDQDFGEGLFVRGTSSQILKNVSIESLEKTPSEYHEVVLSPRDAGNYEGFEVNGRTMFADRAIQKRGTWRPWVDEFDVYAKEVLETELPSLSFRAAGDGENSAYHLRGRTVYLREAVIDGKAPISGTVIGHELTHALLGGNVDYSTFEGQVTNHGGASIHEAIAEVVGASFEAQLLGRAPDYGRYARLLAPNSPKNTESIGPYSPMGRTMLVSQHGPHSESVPFRNLAQAMFDDEGLNPNQIAKIFWQAGSQWLECEPDPVSRADPRQDYNEMKSALKSASENVLGDDSSLIARVADLIDAA